MAESFIQIWVEAQWLPIPNSKEAGGITQIQPNLELFQIGQEKKECLQAHWDWARRRENG